MDHFISDYLDIIIFAAIAVVLLWRLHSVLGTRNDSDVPPVQNNAAMQKKEKAVLKEITGTVQFTDKQVEKAVAKGQALPPVKNWTQNLPDFSLVSSATVHNALIQIPAFDPEFQPNEFMDKARKAFVLIVQAYAAGNKNTLEMLLSPNLFQHFAEQIDAREKAKETYFSQFHGLQKALISDAVVEGTKAKVTVDFTAEQSITHKDVDGKTINHRDGKRVVTRDRWVFSRDLKAASPFWILDTTLEHAE
jgi:predicted lipid-binding transport protein (Tim44 family)